MGGRLDFLEIDNAHNVALIHVLVAVLSRLLTRNTKDDLILARNSDTINLVYPATPFARFSSTVLRAAW